MAHASLSPVGIQKLFDTVVIDWERLQGPTIEPQNHGPPGDGAGGSVSLESFREEDLHSVPSLRALYREAVSRGLVADSEGGLIAFCSTASLCLRVGDRPAALFVYLMKRGEFPATLADEDRACSALKQHAAARRKKLAWLKVK